MPCACLPVSPCLIRLALTRHASRDVIVPIVSLIVSPCVSSSPLAPPSDTPGGEGCLLGLAVPFMSARRGIIRPRFSSNRSSPRLLACCPMPINHWGRLRRSVSDCGDDCCVSYLLGYQSAPSFRSHPPRPIDTRTGENDGAGFLVLGAVIRFACPFDCVGVGGGSDCISRMGVLNCLPAILRLPGNTSATGAGRHGVGSRSGSIVSPSVSYSLRFRILSIYCPATLPRAVPSVPFPCLLRPLIASSIVPCSSLPLT